MCIRDSNNNNNNGKHGDKKPEQHKKREEKTVSFSELPRETGATATGPPAQAVSVLREDNQVTVDTRTVDMNVDRFDARYDDPVSYTHLLGVEFKNNVKKAWLKKFVQESPYNVGLDAAIIMNPQTWVTTGHVSSFSDPLLDCRACKARHRADKLIGEEHPEVNVDAMSFDRCV